MALPNTSFTVGQTETVTAVPEDSSGNPGTIAASAIPAWQNSAPAIASMAVAPDGMSAQFTGLSQGSTTITVSVNNGSGTIVGQFVVNVTERQASQIAFSFGNPS